LWLCSQPVEQASFGDGEGFVADIAAAPFFLLTVNADVLPTYLASRRTVDIRAK
jgi:hypothetical protein